MTSISCVHLFPVPVYFLQLEESKAVGKGEVGWGGGLMLLTAAVMLREDVR